MGSVNSLQRHSLNEDVADRIRQFIIDRGLKPGDRLPTEQELATQLSVSRTSVREATRALAFIGLVESAPRRGMTVAPVDMQRLTRYLGFHFAISDYPPADLLEARIAIECGSLPMAMVRMQQDPTLCDRLNEINRQLEAVTDADRFIELDSAFHCGLVEASGIGPLIAFSDLLHIFFRVFRASIIHKQAHWLDGVATQRQIIDALRKAQLAKATRLLRQHLDAHRDHIPGGGLHAPDAPVPPRVSDGRSTADQQSPPAMSPRQKSTGVDADMTGQVAIVTGAGGGIGQAIADRLSECGCTVVYTDINGPAAEQAASRQPRGTGMKMDVTRAAQIRKVIGRVMKAYGRIDVLVNNAGVNTLDHRVTLDRFPREEWDRIIDVDLNGVYEVSRAVIPEMRARSQGRIINITSIVGTVPLRRQCAFVAAKAGVANLTKAMALELGPDGILVNAIAPGSTLTDGTRSLFYGEDGRFKSSVQQLLDHIPLGRPGSVHEIAHAALFLADPRNTYMTGHILTVDGGWTAGYAREF
jgi:NAD(P)-dependent dehydrogenase (short-subunit alcohol dehydrogenase family)/DNA-binding FadR family transcriptional regulator